jgi:hypothetical protein
MVAIPSAEARHARFSVLKMTHTIRCKSHDCGAQQTHTGHKADKAGDTIGVGDQRRTGGLQADKARCEPGEIGSNVKFAAHVAAIPAPRCTATAVRFCTKVGVCVGMAPEHRAQRYTRGTP